VDPATAAIIASVAISVISSIIGGNAKKRALRRQAASEEAQAAIAMQDAQYEAWRQRMSTQNKVGAARVALASSGVDTGAGTAADTLGQIATVGAMDEQLAEVKGNRVAWTHLERARLLRAGVEDVTTSQFLDIGTTLIGAYAQYSAIGKPANPSADFNQAMGAGGWDPAVEFGFSDIATPYDNGPRGVGLLPAY
jgi:hypothetical protein